MVMMDNPSSPGRNRQQQRGVGEIVKVTIVTVTVVTVTIVTVTKALEMTMKGLNE